MDEQTAIGPEREQSANAAPAATVHEIRPVESLKVCPACLVSSSADNTFCTTCGTQLTTSEAAALPEPATEVIEPVPPQIEHTAVIPPQPLPAPVAAAPKGRRWPLVVSLITLVLALAAAAGLAVLWQKESHRVHTLSRNLAATQASLHTTKATLKKTQASLASTQALSAKRRAVLLQAQDVLTKVDPLLSSVDNIQNKASAVVTQGSTLSGDSETFISTVSDLVNYMVDTNAAYYDYSYISQQIDSANSELDTIRADEGIFSDNTTAERNASDAFGTKASAFTQSVRTLQKQLKQVAGK